MNKLLKPIEWKKPPQRRRDFLRSMEQPQRSLDDFPVSQPKKLQGNRVFAFYDRLIVKKGQPILLHNLDVVLKKIASFFKSMPEQKDVEFPLKLDKNKDTIVVLMGGSSPEREISLKSGKNVCATLIEAGYNCIPVDAIMSVDELATVLKKISPRCVFNALHGGFGEDGSVQALLNMLKIPYTHSGSFACFCAMNKEKTREIAMNEGVPVADGGVFKIAQLKELGPCRNPLVFKPVKGGSSIGVYILNTGDEVANVLPKDLPDDEYYLVEKYIPGREISIGVMDGRVLGSVEIVPQKDKFYDYQQKYDQNGAQHLLPANVSKEVLTMLEKYAVKMHRALGCRGVTRSDFRYDVVRGLIYFLEINALPGLTSVSLIPEMARKKGISYLELVEWLILNARYEK